MKTKIVISIFIISFQILIGCSLISDIEEFDELMGYNAELKEYSFNKLKCEKPVAKLKLFSDDDGIDSSSTVVIYGIITNIGVCPFAIGSIYNGSIYHSLNSVSYRNWFLKVMYEDSILYFNTCYVDYEDYECRGLDLVDIFEIIAPGDSRLISFNVDLRENVSVRQVNERFAYIKKDNYGNFKFTLYFQNEYAYLQRPYMIDSLKSNTISVEWRP